MIAPVEIKSTPHAAYFFTVSNVIPPLDSVKHLSPIKATAVLVVHDEAGKVASHDLRGLGGIQAGSFIVVNATRGESGAFIANGVYVDTKRVTKLDR